MPFSLFRAQKTHFRIGKHENEENTISNWSFANPNLVVIETKTDRLPLMCKLAFVRKYRTSTNYCQTLFTRRKINLI
jgi:hypothetical protein